MLSRGVAAAVLAAASVAPAVAQTVTASPDRLIVPGFDCNVEDSTPLNPMAVRIRSTPGTGLLAFTDPTANWVQVSPTQFSIPATGFFDISVSVRKDRMRRGFQRAWVGIARTGTQTLAARINVEAECFPETSFSLERRELTAEASAGGPVQTARVTMLRNPNVAALNTAIDINALPRANWLSSAASRMTIAANRDTAPLDVRIDPSSLPEGTHEGYLDVVDTAATQSINSLKVTVTVRGAPAVLVVPTATLRFSAPAGGANPAAQTVAITSSTGAVLNFTAAPATQNALPWLLINGSGSAFAAITPAELRVSVNTQGLAAGTHRGSVAVGLPGQTTATIPVELTISGPTVTVSSVQNGASFGTVLAPGGWATLFGSSLAPITPVSRTWDGAIVNDVLPTALDGVRVTIDGRSAPVYYISNAQVNFLVPANTGVGNNISVVVTNGAGTSNTATATVQSYAPAFFMVQGTRYAVAQHFPDYAYVGAPGLIPGGNFRRARPDGVILLYATGFGPTSPAMNTSNVVRTPLRLPALPRVTIGGVAATVLDANLTYAGVYQLNVVVPSTLRAGDHAVVAEIGGVRSPDNVLLTVGP